MKEILEYLSEIKVEKYNDLISSIELQKDILEEIIVDITKNHIGKILASGNYELSNKTIDSVKLIKEKINELNELIIKEMELDEENTEDIEKYEKTLPKDYDKYRVDENEKHTLYESFKNKRPCAFSIENQKFEINNWKEVLLKTCSYLISKNKKIMEEIVKNESIKGRKRILLSKNRNQIFNPEKLNYIDGYIETNLSADSIKNLIKRILKLYDIPLTKYFIYLRADYNNMK